MCKLHSLKPRLLVIVFWDDTNRPFRSFSSNVGAEQARVMLQLAVSAEYSMDEIRKLFEGPLREAVYTSANLEIYGLFWGYS